MTVILSEDEASTLRALLQDHLPDLRWEVARTNEHALRHALVKRQDLCERLLDQLQSAPA